jgi:RNA polymerase primary sigma factor
VASLRTDEVVTFNITRERIPQIEDQSLNKLRSLAEAQKLRDVA